VELLQSLLDRTARLDPALHAGFQGLRGGGNGKSNERPHGEFMRTELTQDDGAGVAQPGDHVLTCW
jgi:hypothetical protein